MTWVVGHPWTVIVLSLCLVVALATGLQRVYFEDDYEVFFDGDNPHLLAHHEVEETFVRQDWYTFLIEHGDGNVFSRRSLSETEWLTEKAWELPFTVGVDSIANFQYTEADGDDLVVSDLFGGAADMPDAKLQKRIEYAHQDPTIPGRMFSRNHRISVISARIVFPSEDSAENTRVARAGDRIAAAFTKQFPDSKVHLAGSVVINQAFLDGGLSDFTSLVPLMLVIVLVAAGLILRSFWAAVTIFVLVAVSVVSAVGFASWLGLPLTVVSVTAPTIIMTVSVAAAIHLLSGLLRRMRAGMSKADALFEAFRSNLTPVSLTSLTTAIGLFALVVSDVPPYRYLGITSAAGAVLTFVFAYSLVPALIRILPLRRPAGTAAARDGWVRLADAVIANRHVLLIGFGVIALALTSFAPRNVFNDGFVNYFDRDVPARKASEFWMENLEGYYIVNYAFRAPEEGGAHDPEYLQNVEKFVQWALAKPDINSVMTINHTYKRLNQVMHAGDPEWYRLPGDRQLAAQTLLLYQMSLPRGVDLTSEIDSSHSVTIVGVPISSAESRVVRDFSRESERWIRENLPESMHTVGTGGVVMFAYIWQASAIANLTGGLVAGLLIAVVLMVALGGIRIGLISLIPNLLPAGIVFGIWGLFVGQIDVAATSVVIVSLGIVVDDTIHFLTRYRRALVSRGATPEDAVRYAFRSVGRALATTSAVLVAGFLVLTQSQITLNSTMGLMSAGVVAIALLLDFLLLPPLLLAIDGFRRRKQQQTPAPVTEAK